MRILYVQATFVPPPTNRSVDRFQLLSETLEGDVLQPVWFRTPAEVEEMFGPGSYPIYTAGGFRYHFFLSWRYEGVLQRIETFWFYLRKGLELCRRHRYDCIVAYSHMTTGLCAALLKLFARTKLIIEIMTAPQLIYLTDRPHPGWKDRLMHAYSDLCLHLTARAADRAHVLYPGQLSAYPSLRIVRNSVFADFVPISMVPERRESSERYVLMVGAPWFLKGADRIIQAFLRLARDFPDVKLKILGWFPDRTELDRMIGGSPQIEVLKARAHPEALQVISGAAIMVLPSRCEGLPRALIEGMTAGLPLIGSDVAGIPFLIRDGENGFVAPGGDPQVLEKRLRQLLSDPDLRAKMGENSRRRACQEFSEAMYVLQFTRMVEATISGEKP